MDTDTMTTRIDKNGMPQFNARTPSEDGKEFDAIFFNGMESGVKIGDSLDAAYSIENNAWNGNEKLQLKIRDIKFG